MLFNYELTLMTAGSLAEADSKKVIEARMVQVHFVSESAPIKDLNKALNIEEGLMRYLLLKHNPVKEGKVEPVAKKKK